MFSELPLTRVVYGFMNGAIFKVFGVAILIFDLLLAIMFALTTMSTRLSNRGFFVASLLFLGFVLLSALIAVGLIRLHRWAAVTASVLGVIWSFSIAAALGQQAFHFFGDFMLGVPIVFGMLLPLYATIRSWSSLRTIDDSKLKPYYRALRSLDPLHLE